MVVSSSLRHKSCCCYASMIPIAFRTLTSCKSGPFVAPANSLVSFASYQARSAQASPSARCLSCSNSSLFSRSNSVNHSVTRVRTYGSKVILRARLA